MVERIVAADHPDWRPGVSADPRPSYDLSKRN